MVGRKLVTATADNRVYFFILFTRFDKYDLSAEQHQMGAVLDSDLGSTEPMRISEKQAVKQLKRISPSKSAGPDVYDARVLKVCANQFSYCSIQYMSTLILSDIPTKWKTSYIVRWQPICILCNLPTAQKLVLKMLCSISSTEYMYITWRNPAVW